MTMTMTNKIKTHPSYKYIEFALSDTKDVPDYVKKQLRLLKPICDDKDEKYMINLKTLKLINRLLKNMKMHKGLKTGWKIYDALDGYQWCLIIASLCVVYRDDPKRRKYQSIILEICRKNGKTFIVALLFILLFILEPKFSKFYSVAPDGSLSREIKTHIEELIVTNSHLLPLEGSDKKFKIRRDDIFYFPKSNKLIPLNYSTSRLDSKEPSVFIVDEVGALPSAYAIEAMRSGQLQILNKLGFIISTKYPYASNPFEDEVNYCKKVLDGLIDDEQIFALLYEPDDTEHWESNDEILRQANPLSLESEVVMDELYKKRAKAIETESRRENFITKHCNIIYQGVGTETFIPINNVQACKVDRIDWSDREVYLGVDLSMSNDNCAVAMVSIDDNNNILASATGFIPEGRIEEKIKFEKVDYKGFIKALTCIACGDMTVDYAVIEQFVFDIEEQYGVTVVSIGYDRYNALSSAQKWDQEYTTVQIRQHSDTLHPPTKLLYEKVLNKEFQYEENKLLEINFENAKCVYDTNMNRYVNKKKSNGKVDMVVALINAIYLLEQDVILDDGADVIQVA